MMSDPSQQITNRLIMVRPKSFGFNAETENSNKFQKRPDRNSEDSIRMQAVREFDEMVRQLRDNGIEVRVFEDAEGSVLPDSVFPNNWISTHEDGSIYTYPMESAIRRKERREDIIQSLEKDFQVTRRYSLELFELQQQYLEGTGSLVLDRKNKLAYACLSPRTDVRVLHKFGLLSGYEVIYFEARDKNGYSIYHTNVLMAMGLDFVICCMDAVDAAKREYLETVFAKTGKELVSISFEQMEHFAGNMLQVRAADGSPYLIMSQTAYQSLTPEQLSRLKAKTRVLVADIPTIESIGGGSVRCMMAENYLKPRD